MTVPTPARPLRFAAWLLPASLAVATAVAARPASAEPSTRPADTNEPDRPVAAPNVRRGMNDGDGSRRDRRDNEPPENRWGRVPVTAQEWGAIEQFLTEYSPNRLTLYNAAVEQFGTDDVRVSFARKAIAARYRMLRRLETENAQLYAQGLEQVQREDELWGLVLTLQKNPDDADTKRQLTEKVRDVVRLVLNERQARLERIRKNLDTEEAALKADEERVDDLVAAQIKRYLEGGILTEMRRPDGGPGGGPGGPRGPEGGPRGSRDGEPRHDGRPDEPHATTRPTE